MSISLILIIQDVQHTSDTIDDFNAFNKRRQPLIVSNDIFQMLILQITFMYNLSSLVNFMFTDARTSVIE